MTLKELEKAYNEQADKRKAKIKEETNRFKRFWKWVWYIICFPWVWLFYNVRDWRSLICLLRSLILWSASVWIWYVLYFLTQNEWFFGIGTAVWVWWLSPVGSPFILLSTMTAIGIKAIFNKIKSKNGENNANLSD